MKTFAVRRTFFQHNDNEFVGGGTHRQGTIFVAAKKKADAIETLKSFGYHVSQNDCKLGMGNDMDALNEAGLITEDRLTLASSTGRVSIGTIYFDDEGARKVETIGSLETSIIDFTQTFVPKA